MKNLILSILTLIPCFLISQDMQLDQNASKATWTGYGEIGGFYQTGSISLESGKISLMEDEIVSGTIHFSTRTISHENKDLEKHLKAKDFFNTNKYPIISFQIKEINDSIAIGDLTIRGISNEEQIVFDMTTERGKVIITGKGIIDRTLYDIKYNSSSYFQDLGNYAIKNNFDLEFTLVFESDI